MYIATALHVWERDPCCVLHIVPPPPHNLAPATAELLNGFHEDTDLQDALSLDTAAISKSLKPLRSVDTGSHFQQLPCSNILWEGLRPTWSPKPIWWFRAAARGVRASFFCGNLESVDFWAVREKVNPMYKNVL